ncbi:MAG: 2-isopropylmalate synthase [Anaerolineae bacterium]|nr:2-isopropylmalate synthase [Anaerolineae bacterium]
MDEPGVITDTGHIAVVRIFDTTLRDGEQSPGCSMTSAEKIDVARQLARLGVDIIEAGFPAASPDDLAAVQRIAKDIGAPDGPVICGLARCIAGDIDKAWDGVQAAAKPRIHTFISTSDIHLEHQFRMTRTQALERAVEMVTRAKGYCDDVEFSPMDAGRSDWEYVRDVLAAVIEAGATTLNIPDTVGYQMPDEYGAMMRWLIENTPGADTAIWSTHCHNDLGLAVANSLAGVKAGARQVEATVNGIGERAGNAALEEVVMALHTRKDFYDLRTNIDTTQIARTSRMVINYTGSYVQANKAVVGANAFAHESGIHQDGILKHKSTYEIMQPEDVGISQTELVLGKHSGRHALKVRLQEMGYEVNEEELQQIFKRFKELADKKKTVTDADLEALIADEFYGPEEIFSLDDIQVVCGRSGMPTATLRIIGPEGEEHVVAGIGTGPVDAAYSAIDKVVKAPVTLLEYRVNAITEGIDAQGEVTVRIRHDYNGHRRTFGGHGADTDIIVASAKAYMAALNRMLAYIGWKNHVPEGPAAAVQVSAMAMPWNNGQPAAEKEAEKEEADA